MGAFLFAMGSRLFIMSDMDLYLEKFVESKFQKPGSALDLGAGDFSDVASLRRLGWDCEGVDMRTGVDLEKPFRSIRAPFDLVFSNYLLHKIKNKKQFIKTALENLKVGGWFFLHTFDKSDPISKKGMDANEVRGLLQRQGFVGIHTTIFGLYDNEEGHKHRHVILEVTAKR